MLKLNLLQLLHGVKKNGYSNTTLVKVKLYPNIRQSKIYHIQIQHLLKLNKCPKIIGCFAVPIQIQHLLKLNLIYLRFAEINLNSNTTLVKVKCVKSISQLHKLPEFKYNTC